MDFENCKIMYFYNANKQNMDLKAQHSGLFHESFSLITHPARFWHRQSAGGFTKPAFGRFFLPWALLTGLAVLLGELLWGSEILWSFVLIKALRETVSYLLLYFLSSAVVYKLLGNFKGGASRAALNSVLAYSLLPFLMASIITGLFPGLYIVGIVGLYGFYLLILGTQLCLEVPKENQSRFIILSILMIVLIFGTVNMISWKLFQAYFPYGA